MKNLLNVKLNVLFPMLDKEHEVGRTRACRALSACALVKRQGDRTLTHEQKVDHGDRAKWARASRYDHGKGQASNFSCRGILQRQTPFKSELHYSMAFMTNCVPVLGTRQNLFVLRTAIQNADGTNLASLMCNVMRAFNIHSVLYMFLHGRRRR